jgi:CPA2 family monovalent cation:H+ antiporter-2
MTVMCLILGTAWIARWWGLSLAMGAFLAGMVISESVYVHEIAAQIFPFRDVFNGVFFISVGMLLDLPFLVRHLPMILFISVTVVLLKGFCAGAAIRTLKYPWRVSVIGAVGLAQIGEFSFLLMSEGFRDGLVGTDVYQYLLAVAILTMVATPFLIRGAPWAARFFVRRVVRGDELEEPAAESPGAGRIDNHVIIAGYGMNGKNLALVLRSTHVPYLVVDLNDALVREGREAGEPVFFGDVNNPEILDRVGVGRARTLVLAISDPMATRRAVAVARRANPGLTILVRTRYVADVDDLISLGANAVIPEEFETSVEIFSRVLHEYHVPAHIIAQQEELIRSGTYRILRERVPSGGDSCQVRVSRRRQLFHRGFAVGGTDDQDLPFENSAGIVCSPSFGKGHAIIRRPCGGDGARQGQMSSSTCSPGDCAPRTVQGESLTGVPP